MYSSASSFCLILYELGRSVTYLNLRADVLADVLWPPELYAWRMSPMWAACTLLLGQDELLWVCWQEELASRLASRCCCRSVVGQSRPPVFLWVCWWGGQGPCAKRLVSSRFQNGACQCKYQHSRIRLWVAAASFSVPMRSLNCFLPLREALQRQ